MQHSAEHKNFTDSMKFRVEGVSLKHKKEDGKTSGLKKCWQAKGSGRTSEDNKRMDGWMESE